MRRYRNNSLRKIDGEARAAAIKVLEMGVDNYVRAYHQSYGVPPRFLKALGEAHGRRYTTLPSFREAQVLEMAAQGLDSAEVAKILGISVYTVKDHKKKASVKLGAKNGAHAVAIAIRKGYIQPPPRRDPR